MASKRRKASATPPTDSEFLLSGFDREFLEQDTEPAADAYFHFLDVLVKNELLSAKVLYSDIKTQINIGEDHFYSEYKRFRGARRTAVLAWLEAHDYFRKVQKSAALRLGAGLFSELADFLDIQSGSLIKAPGYLSGTYQTWRHSTSTPGAYIKSMLRIFEKDKVLFASMQQRYVPVDDVSKAHLESRFEYQEGHIFRQSGGRCFLFLSDRHRRQVRICILPGTSPWTVKESYDTKTRLPPASKSVHFLSGIEIGTEGNKSYSSPIYIERVSTQDKIAQLRESLNIYFQEETPRRVRAILSQPLQFF